MNLFNLFKKQSPDLTFIDTSNTGTWKDYPPVPAKTLKPLKDYQVNKYGDYRLVICPGIHDYVRSGYIIPAWTKISFKANKAGCAGFTGTNSMSRPSQHPQPRPMGTDVADGTFTFLDNIKPNAWNLNSPWKIIGTPNLSALILPATYFNKKLNDGIFVYPGVVDYANFYTINVICSVIKRGEFVIEEGEPLLHVIPFKVSEINAEYGLATKAEQTYTITSKYFHTESFYRKYFLIKKKFNLKTRKSNE